MTGSARKDALGRDDSPRLRRTPVNGEFECNGLISLVDFRFARH